MYPRLAFNYVAEDGLEFLSLFHHILRLQVGATMPYYGVLRGLHFTI